MFEIIIEKNHMTTQIVFQQESSESVPSPPYHINHVYLFIVYIIVSNIYYISKLSKIYIKFSDLDLDCTCRSKIRLESWWGGVFSQYRLSFTSLFE